MRSLFLALLLYLCLAAMSALVFPAPILPVEALFNLSGTGDSKVGTQNPNVGSTPPPTPPSNFGVSYAIGEGALSVAACFMNSLNALETMALLEWEEPITTAKAYQLPGFTETRIEVVPTGDKLERRFAIWGIYLGISEMWSRDLFLATNMTLTWDGQAVGSITFKFTEQPSNGTISLEKRSESPPRYSTGSAGSTNTTGGSDVIADEPRCILHFDTIGTPASTMDFQDVLFPILASLVELAVFPSSARLHHKPGHVYRRDWFRLLEGFNGRIFLFEHPRGEPPYLEYGDLVITLVKLVWYMIGTLRFGPTSIDISVDGVKVGAGTFLKRGMAPDPHFESP